MEMMRFKMCYKIRHFGQRKKPEIKILACNFLNDNQSQQYFNHSVSQRKSL